MTHQQWGPAPTPEKRPSFVKRHPVTTVFIILFAIGMLAVGGCAALIGGAAHEVNKSVEESTGDKAQKDLTRAEYRRDCAAGLCVGYVDYTIVNHTKDTKDYDVAFTVDAADGSRVGEASAFETSVKAGQTVKGSEPVTVDNSATDSVPAGLELGSSKVTRY